MISGIIGVPLGTLLTQRLKKHSYRNDPIVCACGLLISAPLLAGGMIMITENVTIAFILVFFGEVALNLNWAIVADILLVRLCVFYLNICSLHLKKRLNLYKFNTFVKCSKNLQIMIRMNDNSKRKIENQQIAMKKILRFFFVAV